jgi:AcrR family transcriptional regulator
MEGVAKRAGVGKVTVYRRYSNRRELLVAALRTQAEDMSVRGRDVRENLEAILSQMAEMMLDGNAGVALARILSEKDSEPELLSIYRECGVWPRRKQIRDQLRKGRHEGLIRKDADLDVMVDMFYAVCIGRLVSGVGYDGKFAAEALDLFWRGAGQMTLD